jgi:hypothetical protein
MPQEPQSSGVEQQNILKAIQTMLGNLGKQSDSGAGPIVQPGTTPPTAQPTIQFDPSRAGGGAVSAPPPRPYTPMPQTQQTGEQSTRSGQLNAGMTELGNTLTGMFNKVSQDQHEKTAKRAEDLMMQINGFIASGDPEDRARAQRLLEDPKNKKILEKGLQHFQVEEETVPPEAHGVQTAIQKIGQKGQSQQQPQKHAVLPQPSQDQQIQAAMKSAILQKIKQDPGAAISMMGGSQLSSAEQHADEFYKAGLGLSPTQIGTMTAQEKLAGLKVMELATTAAIRGEIDMYKAGIGYKGKVDSAQITANARRYAADAMKDAWASRDEKKGSGAGKNYAAGAKIFEDYAKKYLDLSKSGKQPNGQPLTDEQKKAYEQKADAYEKMAKSYLDQAGNADLINLFMNTADDGDPNAADGTDEPTN